MNRFLMALAGAFGGGKKPAKPDAEVQPFDEADLPTSVHCILRWYGRTHSQNKQARGEFQVRNVQVSLRKEDTRTFVVHGVILSASAQQKWIRLEFACKDGALVAYRILEGGSSVWHSCKAVEDTSELEAKIINYLRKFPRGHPQLPQNAGDAVLSILSAVTVKTDGQEWIDGTATIKRPFRVTLTKKGGRPSRKAAATSLDFRILDGRTYIVCME